VKSAAAIAKRTKHVSTDHQRDFEIVKTINMDVELILSIVLAGATVFYTIINLMMWFESRATRRQKNTPLIIAFLKVTEDHNTLSVHLKNVGEGYAKDVTIKVLKDYNLFKNNNRLLSGCFAFKNGVNIFPSGYELKYYLDTMGKIDYTHEDSCIELRIDYKDMKGKKYINNLFKLPFNQVADYYSNPPESYMGQIPYYLNEINKTIKSVKNQ
jgi:hypothetical protein